MKQQYKIPCINRYGEVIMSLLQKQITLKGIKGRRTVSALFDSGASYSCIRGDVAESIDMVKPLDEPMVFETADREATLTADYMVQISFFFADTERRFTDEFIVLDQLGEELIIGAATMQKWKIRLDFEREEIVYDRKMHRLRI